MPFDGIVLSTRLISSLRHRRLDRVAVMSVGSDGLIDETGIIRGEALLLGGRMVTAMLPPLPIA